MKRFNQFKEASAEVADISVGKKKKAPAGIKTDPDLKGFAYNEKEFKPHTMYDPKTGKAHKAEKPEDHERMAKLGYTLDKPEVNEDMSLDDIKKKYAKEIIAFQNGDGDLSHGASMAMHGYVGSDAIKTDDPDEFDKFVMGLQMGKYKKTEEQVSMDILLTMLEETNLDEALSPKEKEKRLQMIKRAVEKLNRANIEKVKKMAMRDMKAAGMFDDVLEEESDHDSYYAMQAAKANAKKDGKVWDSLGQDEKERYIDKEMTAAGYEKKDGNTKYTRIPTDQEKKFADKVRADDKAASKMSDDDKVDYYSKNPHKSAAGQNVSDKGKVKIEIARLKDTLAAIDKQASEAMEKAYEAEADGDDLAFEKYQEEAERHEERSDRFQQKIQDLKDKLSDM